MLSNWGDPPSAVGCGALSSSGSERPGYDLPRGRHWHNHQPGDSIRDTCPGESHHQMILRGLAALPSLSLSPTCKVSSLGSWPMSRQHSGPSACSDILVDGWGLWSYLGRTFSAAAGTLSPHTCISCPRHLSSLLPSGFPQPWCPPQSRLLGPHQPLPCPGQAGGRVSGRSRTGLGIAVTSISLWVCSASACGNAWQCPWGPLPGLEVGCGTWFIAGGRGMVVRRVVRLPKLQGAFHEAWLSFLPCPLLTRSAAQSPPLSTAAKLPAPPTVWTQPGAPGKPHILLVSSGSAFT